METDAERARALEAVREASADLRAADEAAAAAKTALADALKLARSLELPWAELVEAAGVPYTKLQWWTQREKDYVREARARQVERQRSNPLPPAPGRSAGVGLSVTEAARVLGVTRATVYARIERGELESTLSPAGKTRVLGL